MTNSPNSGQEPEPRSNTRSRARRLFWLRTGLVTGGAVLVGAGAGVWWVLQFVRNDLSPLIANNLSNTLNRPVRVGAVQNFSLTELTLGPSEIPATSNDPDRVQVEKVIAKFNPLEALWDRRLSLDVTLVHPTGYIDQDQNGKWIATQIRSAGGPPPSFKVDLDTLRFQDGSVRLAPYPGKVRASVVATPDQPTLTPQAKPVARPIIVVNHLNGATTFRNNNRLISYDVAGQPDSGGSFRLQGKTDLDAETTTLLVQGQNLLAPDVDLLVPLPIDLKAGLLSADLDVRLLPNNQPIQLFGTTRVRNVTAQIAGLPQLFNRLNGGLRFNGQRIFLENVQGRFGEIPLVASGSLHTQQGYNLAARVNAVDANTILKTFKISAPVPIAGQLQANLRLTGAINQPLISGAARNTQAVKIDRINFDQVQSRFTVTAQKLVFNSIQASPSQGGQVTGNGTVTFGDRGGVVFDLQAQNLPGDSIARSYGLNTASLTVGQVDATAQVFGPLGQFQTVVQWQAPQATYPGRGRVTIADGRIRFDDTVLLVAGGTVRGSGIAANQRWQANVTGSGIQLSRFSPDLRGLFSGSFQLAGRLDNFSPAAIQAEGQARFSQGLAIIRQPLTASVRWLGDRLLVQEATAPGFSGNGYVFAQLQGPGAPAITNLDLNVSLQNYPIAELPIPIPQQIQVAGNTDFRGRVTGPVSAVNVVGRLAVNGLQLNQIAFEPTLTGDFQYAANRRLNLDVAGAQDRIAVTLDGRNRPQSFFVQQGETIAQGRSAGGDRLLAELRNFPIEALNLRPAAQLGLGRVAGLLNGNFDINLANLQNPSVVGSVAVANPALDYISADQFTGQFRYSNGAAVLETGELRRGNSRYLISGSFNPGADQVLQGRVVADQGRVEDVLSALKIFDLADFGRGIAPPTYASAAAVRPSPVGIPYATLLNQLRRYSEINALLTQQIAQREANSFLPDLSRLQGGFTGSINLGFSPRRGPSVQFDLNGQDWTWDKYQVNQITAQGNFQNGVLTLLPLRFQSNDSFLSFSGQVGGAQQSGQLQAANIPVSALRDLFKLPIAIDGSLSANATLAGSVGNPQVVGELNLEGGSLSGNRVPRVRSLFGYSDARLDFNGRVFTGQPDTFRLTGSIPYRFPFMTVEPASNEFRITANIRNEGLSLLNLFTDQVAWKGGQGEVNLQAQGTIQQTENGLKLNPSATGTARFENATIAAKALPQDITNVNGNVVFNNDRIIVQNLQGQFSDGQIVAQGALPIVLPFFPDDPDRDRPLTVSLNNLQLNLQKYYRGGVEGKVVIGGSALAPAIGGGLTLSQGQVLLPENSQTETAAGIVTSTAAPQTNSIFAPPRFDNFSVTLGRGTNINGPLTNFVATGTLVINGTQDDLRPDGTIRLLRGQVNLFTTQFNLVRGYRNTAVFTASRGLDPVLDVQLVALVPEITRYPVTDNSPFAAAEIADTSVGPATNFGEVETVRVVASVNGPASQIFNNLELTSSPRRSETEILALLGGGSYVNQLQQGGGAGVIANLAGSTLLNGLQNLISNVTGLDDFRLFPTYVITDKARNTTLALAAELGFDLTNNFSVSVLQILTTPEPTRFNLRYRINDQLLLRGSVNTAGDSQGVLEFETRF